VAEEKAFNGPPRWRGQRTRLSSLHGDDEIAPPTAIANRPAGNLRPANPARIQTARRCSLGAGPAQFMRPARAAAGLARQPSGRAVVVDVALGRGIRMVPMVAIAGSLLIPARNWRHGPLRSPNDQPSRGALPLRQYARLWDSSCSRQDVPRWPTLRRSACLAAMATPSTSPDAFISHSLRTTTA